MSVNNIHLKMLNNIGELPQNPWVGTSPLSWITSVVSRQTSLTINPEKYSKTALNRSDLYRMSADEGTSDLDFSANVLSWGGMRRDHGARCLETFEEWLGVVSRLRAGRVSRGEAYSEFMSLRLSGNLKGMGPAFFTKLIFFGGKQHNGYIMDQWTGRSVNFLFDEEIVNLNRIGSAAFVTDRNDEIVYEKFCDAIEALTQLVEFTSDPKILEEVLFSSGGRQKGKWRTYLIEQEKTRTKC